MTDLPSKKKTPPGPKPTLPAHSGASDTRLLLKRLREIMAGGGPAPGRLDRIAKIIATNMVAEVCSIYLRRAGDVLELFATEGLNPEAVHKTRLRIGEGIIGDVAAYARAQALSDAPADPRFAYRPETGEEPYQSMMGVPILRAGKVVGVVAVQNRARRQYSEDEVETLQTVAMVLAEMVASGELVSAEELREADGIALLPLRLNGVRLNGGLAIGLAVPHEPRIVVKRLIAEDVPLELDRLNAALAGMYSALDMMLADDALAHGGEHREILETYRMIAEDRGWLGRIRESIEGGLTAEAAVEKVRNENNARMQAVADPYLRERMADFDDLARRVLQHLARGDGRADVQRPGETPADIVVIAHSMGPAELLDYDRARLRGLVLEEGSPTAHVAIVAKALDIPVVGRVRGALARIEPNDPMVVDADHAQVFVRPGEDVQALFRQTASDLSARRAAYAAMRALPAVTCDGVAVSLRLNAGLLVDLQMLGESGADGVGLYRTEIPFMVRAAFPTADEQATLYGRILDLAAGKPVVFRTLDIGGDKMLPYFGERTEDNPAMGWRAIRIGLDHPALLRRQLRALVRAASGRHLDVMFPMVAEVAEFDAARRLLDLELARCAARGTVPPKTIRVGAMVEVPALLFQLPALVERADFLSVGSNDLVQFLFASDRGNPRLAQRYDALAPSVLAMLRQLLATCRAARNGVGIPVTLCGEMAGDPLEAMALIGLGFRRLSMAAPSIGPVKAMVRSLPLESLADYLDELGASAAHSLRTKLLDFARDHGVAL
ncbi:MAG: phosphoenolpyruvate--protein phosphotransferase [Rhodospirillaceae bacterium]|nr:phosphoenolpyruvate--protein phosphotransferase [Rhodospirillaceae bacterium]